MRRRRARILGGWGGVDLTNFLFFVFRVVCYSMCESFRVRRFVRVCVLCCVFARAHVRVVSVVVFDSFRVLSLSFSLGVHFRVRGCIVAFLLVVSILEG